jgi:hypothetical protein
MLGASFAAKTMANPYSYVTVVPFHKARPTKTEAYSLMQLRKLEVKNITLMCPESLDISFYQNLWPGLEESYFTKEHF